MKKHIFLFLGAILAFLGCSDDDSIKNGPTPQPNPGSELDVQHFMWQSMNLWYFWQAEVNDLADDRFSTDAQYTDYLEANPDPEAFYTNKLVHGEDRFSFFNEDYTELVRNLGGVSKSHGVEFKLWLDSNNTNNVYGVVLYVLPGSDGATKDIQRGDGFTRVNGVQLTTANYINLLFGDNDTYTLGMADIESEIDGDFINFYPVDTDREVSLTKTANLVEDPIFVAKTLDVGGTKVAYLMYNRFLGSFDEQLNQAFGDFKADGATELILDMRYNPGGSVNSSRLLASMVYGTNTSDLYIRQRWNAKIQAQLSASDLEDYFADKTKTSNGTAINSLNLNRVFVLATEDSASASELVMNGLEPYVDVIHIGETTRGKNEFSITLVDDIEGAFIYSEARENKINPDNHWGLQPLVGRNENADGFYDYTSGLVPDIPYAEYPSEMGVLGEVDEPLLARALQEISGVSAKMALHLQPTVETVGSSRLHTPLADNMYLDKPLDIQMD